jgi:hypothetical protein
LRPHRRHLLCIRFCHLHQARRLRSAARPAASADSNEAAALAVAAALATATAAAALAATFVSPAFTAALASATLTATRCTATVASTITTADLPHRRRPCVMHGSIAAADVDDDDDLDVLLGNDGSPSHALFNAGDGTFPTSITLPRGSVITGLIAAANLDGDLDVLLANGGNPLFYQGSRRRRTNPAACAAGSYTSIALTPESPLASRALWWPRGWIRSQCNRWAHACVSSECTVERAL